LKNLFGWLVIICALAVIGCGGGGGGGSSTNGSTNSTNSGTTGITMGITGHVRNTSNFAVAGAKVTFYSAGGNVVKTVTTNNGGNFSAQLPTTAKRFSVDLSGVANSQNYFKQFGYGQYDYIADDPGCTAKAPSFGDNQVVALPNEIVLTQLWFGPPPPPEGCLKG
jgi:hypothetical protein